VSNRLFLILAALAIALYMLPRMIQAGLEGYRRGAESRQNQRP
jgi:hypothetical protein